MLSIPPSSACSQLHSSQVLLTWRCVSRTCVNSNIGGGGIFSRGPIYIHTMPARFAERGDVHAAIDDHPGDLTPLLDLYAEQVRNGQGEMPYPPDYPKMPGEPPRVQPSKKVAAHWDADGNWIEKP